MKEIDGMVMVLLALQMCVILEFSLISTTDYVSLRANVHICKTNNIRDNMPWILTILFINL